MRPSPEPLLLVLLVPLALLLPLLMPLSASATKLLLDIAPGKHPGTDAASGSERLLLLLLRLCALLPVLRERLSDLMLLPIPDSALARPLLKLRLSLLPVLLLLLGLGRGVASPPLLLALLRVRP